MSFIHLVCLLIRVTCHYTPLFLKLGEQPLMRERNYSFIKTPLELIPAPYLGYTSNDPSPEPRSYLYEKSCSYLKTPRDFTSGAVNINDEIARIKAEIAILDAKRAALDYEDSDDEIPPLVENYTSTLPSSA